MDRNADYQVQKNDYPNLKGVMLCARPDEKQNIERERQFCSRVNPPEFIGLNPILKYRNLNQRKKKNYADLRHKQWLRSFAGEIEDLKTQAQIQQHDEVDKFYRIREKEAMRRRKIMKHKGRDFDYQNDYSQSHQQMEKAYKDQQIDYDSMLHSIKVDVDSVGRVKAERPPYEQNFLAPDQDTKPNRLKKMTMVSMSTSHKFNSKAKKRNIQTAKPRNRASVLKNRKKQKKKPAWAASQKQITEDDDEVLNFMEEFNVDQFLEDVEVKALVASIQDRVRVLDEETDKVREDQIVDIEEEEYYDPREQPGYVDYNTNEYNDNLTNKRLAVNPHQAKYISKDSVKLQRAKHNGQVSFKKVNHKYKWNPYGGLGPDQKKIRQKVINYMTEKIMSQNQFSRPLSPPTGHDNLPQLGQPGNLPSFLNGRLRRQYPFENYPNVSKQAYDTDNQLDHDSERSHMEHRKSRQESIVKMRRVVEAQVSDYLRSNPEVLHKMEGEFSHNTRKGPVLTNHRAYSLADKEQENQNLPYIYRNPAI